MAQKPHPTFRMNTEVRLRAGEEEGVIVEGVAESASEPPVFALAAVDGWEPMNTAPHDGMVVIVKPANGDMETRAMWRQSRKRDATTRRWLPYGLWADAMTKMELSFEPTGWRHVPGFGPILTGA